MITDNQDRLTDTRNGKLTIFERIICFMGGARISLLRECTYEKNKFIAIGLGVFNTAVLSMLTMWFVIVTIFETNGRSIYQNLLVGLVALFWGIIIFGIDWGLITTMRKHDKKYFNDIGFFKKIARYVRVTVPVLFRLAVAILISFTVSRPIEALVFEDFLDYAKRNMRNSFEEKLDKRFIDQRNDANTKVLSEVKTLEEMSEKRDSTVINSSFVKEAKKDIDVKEDVENKIEESNIISDRVSEAKIKELKIERGSTQGEINIKFVTRDTKRQDLDITTHLIDSLNNDLSQLNILIVNDSNADYNSLYLVQKSINEELNSLKNNQLEVSTEIAELTRELSILYNKRTQIREDINSETNAISNRLDRLIIAQTETDTVKEIRKKLIATLKSEQDSLISTHNKILKNYEKEEDSIQIHTTNEMAKNDLALLVFERNNLINNLNAISYLKSLEDSDDPKEVAMSINIWFIGMLIMLLIGIVDTAPIIIKVLTRRGPYEEIQDRLEQEVKADQRQRYQTSELEFDTNYDLVSFVSKVQRTVTKSAIKKWEEKQIENMDTNYKKFVSEDPDTNDI